MLELRKQYTELAILGDSKIHTLCEIAKIHFHQEAEMYWREGIACHVQFPTGGGVT